VTGQCAAEQFSGRVNLPAARHPNRNRLAAGVLQLAIAEEQLVSIAAGQNDARMDPTEESEKMNILWLDKGDLAMT
jgi:hypothetical protein